MPRFPVVLALASLVLTAPALLADTISYSNVGTVAPTVTLTATNDGPIVGYFVGSNASDTDWIRLVDVTAGWTSASAFNNQTAHAGDSFNFGTVTAGDVLVLELWNQTTNQVFATNGSLSADGVNHGFVTSFGGGTLGEVTFPSGVYVGMEDLANGGDLDYNDDTFVFTNVSAAAPEPGSLILLGTGILGVAGGIRRRLAR